MSPFNHYIIHCDDYAITVWIHCCHKQVDKEILFFFQENGEVALSSEQLRVYKEHKLLKYLFETFEPSSADTHDISVYTLLEVPSLLVLCL